MLPVIVWHLHMLSWHPEKEEKLKFLGIKISHIYLCIIGATLTKLVTGYFNDNLR